ncbi:MAG TPA: HU family DNA-binding protein [Clostridia bacterium]|jgi:DNA-binding protein HU-beta|nr:HU family DNA-binding protein [Clostridia bacterium]
MNKGELVKEMAVKSGLTQKDVQKVLDSFFDTIIETVKKGDKVQLVGIGSFEAKHREARKGRNPQTGEEIEIPARTDLVFKPGKQLKDALN